MDSPPVTPSEHFICLDGDPAVEALPSENLIDQQEEPVVYEEPDTTTDPIILDIPAYASQSNDPRIQEEFGAAELQDIKEYMEKIDKQSEIAQPSNITVDGVANVISVRMTQPQFLTDELLDVIDQVFGTIINNDKGLKRLVEEAGELTDLEAPSPAKTSFCKMSCVENEEPHVYEVEGPMVSKFEEAVADDVVEATEPKFENEESVVSELEEEPMEPKFEDEELGIIEMTEPTELSSDLEEVSEVMNEPIMSEESEHEEYPVSQLHSNPILLDTLVASPSQSDVDIIREASGETEWKDLKGIIKDIEESSADGENSNITVDKIASIISSKYVEFLEEEWQRRRNVWLRGVERSSKKDDYENFNSPYAFATFGEYVSSQQGHLQVPFDLPEIEFGGDKENPEL